MRDSPGSPRGTNPANCADCGAEYRVKAAGQTYVCKECGGAVTATLNDDGTHAGPDRASIEHERAQRSAKEQLLHTAHVTKLVHEREERKKFARAHKNVENVLSLIGNVLWFSLLVSGIRVAAFGFIVFDFAATGTLPSHSSLIEVIGTGVVELVALVLLVLMKRKLRHAPVGIAGVVAALKVLAAAPIAYFAVGASVVSAGISLRDVYPALLVVPVALFHIYAYFSLRKHRATILHLRQIRAA